MRYGNPKITLSPNYGLLSRRHMMKVSWSNIAHHAWLAIKDFCFLYRKVLQHSAILKTNANLYSFTFDAWLVIICLGGSTWCEGQTVTTLKNHLPQSPNRSPDLGLIPLSTIFL